MKIDKKFVTPDFREITQVDLDKLNNLIIQTGRKKVMALQKIDKIGLFLTVFRS